MIGNADCPPSWYFKFVISGSFNLLDCMRDPGLFISVGERHNALIALAPPKEIDDIYYIISMDAI